MGKACAILGLEALEAHWVPMELPGSATNNNRDVYGNGSSNDNANQSRSSVPSMCQALGLLLDLYHFTEPLDGPAGKETITSIL